MVKEERHYFNPEPEREWNSLKLRQKVKPRGRNHHPFETSKSMSGLYGKVKDKEAFNKIAQDFLGRPGCGKEGRMRKKAGFHTADFSKI
ncbi:MAG: hypothetical protein JXN64_10040 [Spirochaetes bacterium]|nr:hypothetical protein [Spirochaetota bacterium]